MILDSINKSLEVILGGAITTNQLDWAASYVDVLQATLAMTAVSETDGATNSAVAVTMVAAPGAGTSRQIKELSVYNKDTVNTDVTIRINDNGTFRIKNKSTLAPGDTLYYAG